MSAEGPYPEGPYPVTRYHCPAAGCTWHHDERPGDDPAPARLPEDFTYTDLGEAISAIAAQRALNATRRVEGVLREHLALHHPGFKIDEGRRL